MALACLPLCPVSLNFVQIFFWTTWYIFFSAFRKSLLPFCYYGSAVCHIYLCMSPSRKRYRFFLTLSFLSCKIFFLVLFCFYFLEMFWFSQLPIPSFNFYPYSASWNVWQCCPQLDWRTSGFILSLSIQHSSPVFHGSSYQLMVR